MISPDLYKRNTPKLSHRGLSIIMGQEDAGLELHGFTGRNHTAEAERLPLPSWLYAHRDPQITWKELPARPRGCRAGKQAVDILPSQRTDRWQIGKRAGD